MREIEHEVTGTQRVVAPVVELSATPTAIDRASPPIGAHTSEVLTEAGLAPPEIAALQRDGVIGG